MEDQATSQLKEDLAQESQMDSFSKIATSWAMERHT